MLPARRTAVIGASFALASSGLAGTALAGDHGHAGAKVARTHLTVHAPSNTTGHYKATVTGKLRSHKTGVAGATVLLQHRENHAWADGGLTQNTDADGKVTFTFTQTDKKEQYRLFYAGDDTHRKSHSGTVTITRVKPAPAPEPTTSPEPTESPAPTA